MSISLKEGFRCDCGWTAAERPSLECPWCHRIDSVEERPIPVCDNCNEILSAIAYQYPEIHACPRRIEKVQVKEGLL